MSLSRIYIEDLQKEQNKDKKGRWIPNEEKVRRLIPSCYQMVLSNPIIEKNLRRKKNLGPSSDTEESIRINTYESESQKQNTKHVKQLVFNVKIKNDDVNADFVFGKLRLVLTVPILERLTMFLQKIQRVKFKYLDDILTPANEESKENRPNEAENDQLNSNEEMKS